MYKMSSRIYFEGTIINSEQVKRYSTDNSYIVGNQCTDLYVDERGQSSYILLRCINDTSGDWKGQSEKHEVINQWTIAEGTHTFDNLKVFVESLFLKKVSLSGQCFEQKKIPLNTRLTLLPGRYQFGGMAKQSATRYHLEFKEFNSLESTTFSVNKETTGTLYLVVEPNYVFQLMDMDNILSIKIFQYTGDNWKYHWNPSDWEFVKSVKGYNAGKQYKPGNKCIYQFGLYKCLFTTPSGGESWTPEHWEAVMQDVKQWMDHVDIKWGKPHVRYMAMYLKTNACLPYNVDNETITKNGLTIDIQNKGHSITVSGTPTADTRITVRKNVLCNANHAYYMDGCPSGESKSKHYLEWGPYKSYEGRCSGGKSGATHDLVLVIKKQSKTKNGEDVYDADEFTPELNDTACYDSNCNGIIWKRSRNMTPEGIEIYDLIMYFISRNNYTDTYIDSVEPLLSYSRTKGSSISDAYDSAIYNGIYSDGQTVLRKYYQTYGGEHLGILNIESGRWHDISIKSEQLDGAAGLSVGNTFCKPIGGATGGYIHQSYRLYGNNEYKLLHISITGNDLFFEHLAFLDGEDDGWASDYYNFTIGKWDNFGYVSNFTGKDEDELYNNYYKIITSTAVINKAPIPVYQYWSVTEQIYKRTTPEIFDALSAIAEGLEPAGKDTATHSSQIDSISNSQWSLFSGLCFKDHLYLYYDFSASGSGYDRSPTGSMLIDGIGTNTHTATALVLGNNGVWSTADAQIPWIFKQNGLNINKSYYTDREGHELISTSEYSYISSGFGTVGISETKYPCKVFYAGTYNNKIYVYVFGYQTNYYTRVDEFHTWEFSHKEYDLCLEIFESSDGLSYKSVRKHTGSVNCFDWLTDDPYNHPSGIKGPLTINYCSDETGMTSFSQAYIFQNESTGHAQFNISAFSGPSRYTEPEDTTVYTTDMVSQNSSGEGHCIVKFFGDDPEFATDTFNGFYMIGSNGIICWDSVLLDRPKFFYLTSDGSYSD